MTELDILKRANTYIAKLANGFNPLTDVELPCDTILNNVRISRCLFYVSGILTKVIENGGEIGKTQKSPKLPFNITNEQLMKIEISEAPIAISNFTEKINAAVENENMRKFPSKTINNWLIYKDILRIVIEENGKERKSPTEKGIEIGVLEELRKSVRHGNYIVNLYSEKAQKFILDNFSEIMDFQKPILKDISTEENEVINENLIANH